MREDNFRKVYEDLCNDIFSRGLPSTMGSKVETLLLMGLSEREAHVLVKQELDAIINSVVNALRGCTDYEGNPIISLNYLQGIRKLAESEKLGNEVIVDQNKKIAQLNNELCEAIEIIELWRLGEEDEYFMRDTAKEFLERIKDNK